VFEVAELGAKVDKARYAEEEAALVTALLEAQRAVRAAKVPVLVVVSGVEGAGKNEVVNRLTEWFDPRGVQVNAFWDETDEERERPAWWRFWRRLPPRGSIGLFYGSWYTRPIVDRVFERIDDAALDRQLARIAAVERMLVEDGALIVKLWFHLSKEEQLERIRHPKRQGRGWKVSPLAKRFSRKYGKFARVSERALRATDAGPAPWHIIEATDWRHRDLAAGRLVLEAIQRRLAPAPQQPKVAPEVAPAPEVTVLDRAAAAEPVDEERYGKRLEKLQRRYHELTWEARRQRRSSVIVFEGWDAAGKGSAIRRVTFSMDARLFRVVPIAAPTDEERAQHYLWRFWRHLPMAGNVTIFDRSWYGRVLVERVEGFARQAEWSRAYKEINDFEEQLVEAGTVLTKLWLHIDAAEQLARFKARQEDPRKQYKITDEDWRNREKWPQYVAAVHDMVVRTSTAHAPWTVVAANDKKGARLQILETLCDGLERALAAGP
jgi:AMP-polyphosphate phosphotransferase